MAYENPYPRFDTFNTNNLRLWHCLPSEVFDFLAFHEFRYSEAVKPGGRRRIRLPSCTQTMMSVLVRSCA